MEARIPRQIPRDHSTPQQSLLEQLRALTEHDLSRAPQGKQAILQQRSAAVLSSPASVVKSEGVAMATSGNRSTETLTQRQLDVQFGSKFVSNIVYSSIQLIIFYSSVDKTQIPCANDASAVRVESEFNETISSQSIFFQRINNFIFYIIIYISKNRFSIN